MAKAIKATSTIGKGTSTGVGKAPYKGKVSSPHGKGTFTKAGQHPYMAKGQC